MRGVGDCVVYCPGVTIEHGRLIFFRAIGNVAVAFIVVVVVVIVGLELVVAEVLGGEDIVELVRDGARQELLVAQQGEDDEPGLQGSGLGLESQGLGPRH